jgi:transcriptional regulator with PAS, ATPase and Fis domain
MSKTLLLQPIHKVLFSFFGWADIRGLNGYFKDQHESSEITLKNYFEPAFDLGPTAKCAIYLFNKYAEYGQLTVRLLANISPDKKEEAQANAKQYHSQLMALLKHLGIENVTVQITQGVAGAVEYEPLTDLFTKGVDEQQVLGDFEPVMCISPGTAVTATVMLMCKPNFGKYHIMAWGKGNKTPDFKAKPQQQVYHYGDLMADLLNPKDRLKSSPSIGGDGLHQPVIEQTHKRQGYLDDPKLSVVVKSAQKYALTNNNILLLGETGTGKEELAAFIHEQSLKPGKMVSLNCGLFESLAMARSELFGHVEGAFTDARQTRVGAVEQAKEGTLFLDEIGELTQPMQAALLRFLEDQTYYKLGGDKEITSSCRIVCATSRNLLEMVANGEFKKDLYYRSLAGGYLEVPPFRDLSDSKDNYVGTKEKIIKSIVDKLKGDIHNKKNIQLDVSHWQDKR